MVAAIFCIPSKDAHRNSVCVCRYPIMRKRIERSALFSARRTVKRGIDGIKVFAVQMLLCTAKSIAEAVTEEWILRYP